MPAIALALQLAQFVPGLVKYFTGSDHDAAVAQKVVDVAQVVTGQSGQAAVDALKAAPDLALKFQQAVLDHDADLAKLYGQAVESVNATMRAEAAAEHWPTYSWRPAIGFAFAFNLVAASFLVIGTYAAQVFAWPGADKAIAGLPATLGALAAISGLAAPVLGIASWFRGKMQADPSIPTVNRG